MHLPTPLKLRIAATAMTLASCLSLSLSTAAQSPNSRTHAIDDFPNVDVPLDSPTKAVERTATEQIKLNNKTNDESALAPTTSGNVMYTGKQKRDAAREASNIEQNDPAETNRLPSTTEVRRPTVALALGGGGARGAAHIGVLKVLVAEHIPIDYIVGNSMGSIVGGLYSAGVPLDDIRRIMTDGSFRKAYFPGSIPMKVLTKPFEKLANPFNKHYAGLWTGKKLGQFLERQLPSGVETVEQTRIAFSAVATNLVDGKAYRIGDGKLSTAMRASSSISPFLQPVAIEDKVFMDGGVRANLPASGARDTGADIVIGVLVDQPLGRLPVKRFRHLRGIALRMTDVMLTTADARQLQFADIIISPDVSGIAIFSNKPENVDRAIAAGEAATIKALPEIRRKLKEPPKGDDSFVAGKSDGFE